MVDKAINGLPQNTAPLLTDLLEICSDPGGTPTSMYSTIGDALKLMQGNIIYLTNNDGVAHYAGTVVIFDTSVDNGCKKTTSAGDPKICGVAAETVAAGASGKYFQIGQATVLVQGNVTRGMWVTASATSGRAQAATYTKPTSGGIGIALTSYAGGGAGSVTVLISIQLTSTAPLQQLATVTTNSGTGTAVTTAHTTDTGTNLLIVEVETANAATPSSVTFNGIGMSNYTNVGGGSQVLGIYYLVSPPIGTYNIVVNHASSVTEYVIAINFAGVIAGYIRSGLTENLAGVTSCSLSPTSVVGDIALDIFKGPAGWGPTAGGQSTIATIGAINISTSKRDGAAGSTTMSWAGASGTIWHVAIVICGS